MYIDFNVVYMRGPIRLTLWRRYVQPQLIVVNENVSDCLV